MNPKICCRGLAFVFFLLVGCNTELTNNEETSDPVLVEYPVVYIERDIFINMEDDQPEMARFPVFDPIIFNPGAALFIKKNAFAQTPSVNLTADLFPEQAIDIRDLSISADGQSFLVSIRAPEIADADDEEQPKWNIWQYQHESQTLERLIVDDITADQGDDLMASYLPDGRIIFASNRQKLSKAILLDEGKPQYKGQNERAGSDAFNIHIMQADGSGIKQLSFNLSHDFYPVVLQNGRILYSRWDAMGGVNKLSLYQMLPDGTENQLVYGWHSQELSFNGQTNDVALFKPQQLANGKLLFMLASEDITQYQKRPVVIDIENFIDTNQPITPAVATSAISDLFSEQTFNYHFSNELNLAGRVNAIFGLRDFSGRYLISLDLCRAVVNEQILACAQLTPEQLADETTRLASPNYQLWLFNELTNTQQLVANAAEGRMITESLLLQEQTVDNEFIADKVIGNELDSELYNQQAGAIHIRSVYDIDGIDTSPNGIEQLKDPLQTSAEQRPARFLRLIRGVPMPSRDVRQVMRTDFGRSNGQLMREILGYTPIEPDGSVKVKVPANIPIALSIVNAQGQRISPRHRQWITVRAGETIECHGCHTSGSEQPHGRLSAQRQTINLGANSTGVPFQNTNSNILPEFGQTMAQAAAQTYGIAELSSSLIYQDIWTDAEISTVNPNIEFAYSELQTVAPNGSDCFNNWHAYCRLQINYLEHIAPLWSLERQVVDEVSNELIQDNTCTSCHQSVDADNLAQVPAGQLDLSAIPSSDEPAHLTSYRELFFNDIEQEVIDGILVDRRIPVLDEQGNIVFEVDSEGELILDEQEQPIAVLTTVPVSSLMSPNGAQASQAFFDVFERTDHQNMLSASELKLLYEWLDIGAQYYNTPFYPLP